MGDQGNLYQLLLRDGLARLEALKEWRRVSQLVARSIARRYPDAEVHVFGSVVEGKATGGSDLDLLVILSRDPPRARERAELMEEIEEELGLPPGLLHIVFVRRGSVEERWFKQVLGIRTVKVEPARGEAGVGREGYCPNPDA